MIKVYRRFLLSFLLVAIPIVNSTDARLSLNAAAISKPRLSPANQPSPHLYSYEGKRGRDGQDGRDGENGRSGRDTNITIDGSAVDLDLSGTDGRDGDYGREGSDAQCGSINVKDKSEITLASGGKGGDGGRGGSGGNGGSLTVFYSQLEHLRQINVRSPGGYGGRGGDEGRGGRGCVCPSFIYRTSSLGQDHKSDRKEVRCRSGNDGKYGDVGKDGNNGQPGTLYLVKQGQDLRPDQPNAAISLSPTALGQPIDLSKNLWQSHSGASSLLNPNSVVADTYQEYIKRLEQAVTITWQESQPITDFESQELGLELTTENKLVVAYPDDDVWLDATVSSTGENSTLLAINHAVVEAETTRLKRGLISGSRKSLVFGVIDEGKKSDFLTTQFEIKFRTSRDRFAGRENSVSYKTRYEGIVPAAAITRDNQRFSLALGQLPIDNEYLRPGTLIDIELKIIRSLGENAAEQEINWSGEIRSE
ncbi:MAG: collagen-like protein [Cyanobacteria bacterium J06621_12]